MYFRASFIVWKDFTSADAKRGREVELSSKKKSSRNSLWRKGFMTWEDMRLRRRRPIYYLPRWLWNDRRKWCHWRLENAYYASDAHVTDLIEKVRENGDWWWTETDGCRRERKRCFSITGRKFHLLREKRWRSTRSNVKLNVKTKFHDEIWLTFEIFHVSSCLFRKWPESLCSNEKWRFVDVCAKLFTVRWKYVQKLASTSWHVNPLADLHRTDIHIWKSVLKQSKI